MAGPIRSTDTHLDDRGRTVYVHTFQGRRRIVRIRETIIENDPAPTRAAKAQIWRGGIDVRAVRRACHELGITMPVAVKRMNGKGRRGTHKTWETSTHHTITLSTYSSVHHASGVLWHELAHAAQAERLMREHGCTLYEASCKMEETTRRYGYKNCPLELEAERVRAAHLHTYLTTPRRMTAGVIYSGDGR